MSGGHTCSILICCTTFGSVDKNSIAEPTLKTSLPYGMIICPNMNCSMVYRQWKHTSILPKGFNTLLL